MDRIFVQFLLSGRREGERFAEAITRLGWENEHSPCVVEVRLDPTEGRSLPELLEELAADAGIVHDEMAR